MRISDWSSDVCSSDLLQKATMTLLKETKRHGKWYDDACGTALALELLGERWSLLIVRELMFGGRRFTDLRAGLPGISAKVLTERLEGLEQARSEEHTSELQSLMRISYAVFCLKKKKNN